MLEGEENFYQIQNLEWNLDFVSLCDLLKIEKKRIS